MNQGRVVVGEPFTSFGRMTLILSEHVAADSRASGGLPLVPPQRTKTTMGLNRCGKPLLVSI